MQLTPADIYRQCEPAGNCMEWTGRAQNGSPQVYVGRVNGKSHYRTARRVLMELLRGEPIPSRLRCCVTCGNDMCLAEAHIVLRTYKQIAAINSKNGAQSHPAARAAIARGRRSRADVKLSIEKAREIRASELSGVKLAAIYGVNRTLISAVRRGEVWRESIPGSSVFSMAQAA